MASRIRLKTLADMCRRTATSHAAGLDARTIWRRESETGSAKHQRLLGEVSRAIDGGSTIAEALQQAGDYLPRLMRDMVHVGERTGRLDEILHRLAEYYAHLRTVRAAFLAGIAWPMIQFAVAILLIGVVIWITGFLPGDSELDMVGFGLTGTRGALIYFTVVGVALLVGGLFVRSLLRGQLAARLMRPLMKLPLLGRWLQLMAMSRLAWTLGLAVEAGMHAPEMVRIALRSTQNAYFTQHTPRLVERVGRGDSLYEAFTASDSFPQDFLDSLQVGEETGKLGESMEVLSRQYEQQGKTAMHALAVAAAVATWLSVAAVIIFFIFRFALFYVALLDDAMNI